MGRKKRGRKPTPPEEVELPEDTKANTTDPASQILKTSNGWKQGYNGQAMVDCDTQVIVAQDITTDANDVQQLKPMLENCEEVNGKRPEMALADAGYWSKANAQLADEQTELFIATTKDWKRRKEPREADPPRGRIPKWYGLKERMERKLRTKRGEASTASAARASKQCSVSMSPAAATDSCYAGRRGHKRSGRCSQRRTTC